MEALWLQLGRQEKQLQPSLEGVGNAMLLRMLIEHGVKVNLAETLLPESGKVQPLISAASCGPLALLEALWLHLGKAGGQLPDGLEGVGKAMVLRTLIKHGVEANDAEALLPESVKVQPLISAAS